MEHSVELDDTLGWIAEFLDIEKDEAIETYKALQVSDIAREWGAASPSTPEEMREFYATCKNYLYALVHWNLENAGYRFLVRLLGSVKGKRVLDFGAGLGTLAIALSLRGNVCTYLDLPGIIMDFAKFHAEKRRENGHEFELDWATDIDELGQFDLIVAVDVLEHLPNLQDVLIKFNRHLVEDGLVFAHVAGPKNASEELYPMHIDYDEKYPGMAKAAGFRPYGPFWLKKYLVREFSDGNT